MHALAVVQHWYYTYGTVAPIITVSAIKFKNADKLWLSNANERKHREMLANMQTQWENKKLNIAQ